jgi:FixJ family two-component response regulator
LNTARLISIVDDDMSICRATASLLESYGYATASFASAEEFLQSGRFADTHCLVSDIRMPGLSGIELQRRLIEAGHRVPTIFVTAYPEGYRRVIGLNGTTIGVLPKPVSEEQLISCVESALQGRTEGDATP